jgi:hypothetical protein
LPEIGAVSLIQPVEQMSVSLTKRGLLSNLVTGGEVTGYARIKNQVGGNQA